MTKKNKPQGNTLNRARPLAERIDESPGLWALRELGCKLPCRIAKQSIHWPCPIFSRLALDIPDPTPLLPTLDKLRRNCGISILEPEILAGDQGSSERSSLRLGSGANRSLDDGVSIHPIFVDEPIPLGDLMHAEQIELQFIPSGLHAKQPLPTTSYQPDRWVATLPSDLTDVEKMSKRIELLRNSSDQSTVIVGGTIPAGSVYDDVRFLIDCGVDYVNVLAQVVAGLRPPKSWTLQPIDYVIEQALGAIDKSGVSEIALLVCSPIKTLEDAIRLLSLGVDAFSIDSWLIEQQSALPTSSQSSEDLGSFMGTYTRQAAPVPAPMEGMLAAAQTFVQEFNALRRLYEI